MIEANVHGGCLPREKHLNVETKLKTFSLSEKLQSLCLVIKISGSHLNVLDVGRRLKLGHHKCRQVTGHV